jgi:uncharacterized glyoxalase superfamily protein PhnB
MSTNVRYIPKGLHTITPQLTLDNAATAIEWYKKAFGAVELDRSLDPDGKIIHGVVRIGESHFFVVDAMTGKGPKAFGGSPVGFFIYVENSDTVYRRAVDAGAKVNTPIDNQFWGDRAGAVNDPEGYTWWICTRTEELSKAEVDRRAREFFAKMAPQPVE